MDFRLQAALVLLTLTLGAGCRQNNAQRELLERDLRFQEDRIYELEAELQSVRSELSRYCDPALSPGGSSSGGSSTFSSPSNSSESRSTPSTGTFAPHSHELMAPTVELPSPTTTRKEAAPPYGGPPVILPPDPNVPEGLPGRSVLPGTSSPPVVDYGIVTPPPAERNGPQLKPMSSPKFVSPSMKPRFDALAEPPESVPSATPSNVAPQSPAFSPTPVTPTPKVIAAPMPSDERVTSLTFGKRTGGLNLDGRPGDEGLLIVVESRTARGDVIAGKGDLSIALIDPAVTGDGARFARWDFTATDFAALFRPGSSDEAAGTYLELPWPDGAPLHTRLKLFVRMRTPDGRQLQIDRDVVVELPVGATTNVMPTPFTPTLAPPPAVVPVAAPSPDEHDRSAPATLNWEKQPLVRQAAVPTPAPPQAVRPSESFYETAPVEGPSLGPALIPAVPR